MGGLKGTDVQTGGGLSFSGFSRRALNGLQMVEVPPVFPMELDRRHVPVSALQEV